jgi:curli production assembly/transport component CsgG
MLKALLVIIMGIVLSSCASTTSKNTNTFKGSMPYVEGTPTHELLKELPELDQPQITIAVYRFTDLTGQRKPSTKFSQLSTAVTQGSDVFVINALKSVSNGTWFQVVERNGLEVQEIYMMVNKK